MLKSFAVRRLGALVVLMVPWHALLGAGMIEVQDAWIRTPPPGASMLAGYATLINRSDVPVVVTGATSETFGDVSLHETISADGVERMRVLERIELAPCARVVFAPGRKHLMLMRPTSAVAGGTAVRIHFDTDVGGGADANFVVRDDAPPDH